MARHCYWIIYFILLLPAIYAQNSMPELYRQGMEALKANKTAEAEKSFYQSIMQNKDAGSYYELARLYFDSDDNAKRNLGNEYITRAHLIEPDNFDYHYLYAEYSNFFISPFRKEKELIKLYDRSARLDVLFDLAEIRLNLYDRHVAVKNLELVRFRDRKTILPKLIPEIKADLDTAESRYLKGLSIDNVNYKGLSGIIKLYLLINNYESAISYMERMVKYYPADKTAHLQLGVFYCKTNKLNEGYKEIQKAISLMDPDEKEDFLYNSVESLLEPKYKEVFKNMTKEEKVNFMNVLWKSMDPLYLTDTNERLMEHYIRVAYANVFFSCPNIGLKGWKTDMGQVLIRYGFPSEKMRLYLSMDEFSPLGFTYMYEEYWAFDSNVPALIFEGNKNFFKLKATETAANSSASQENRYVYTIEDLIKFGGGNPLIVFQEIKLNKLQSYKPVLYGSRLDLDARLYSFKNLTPGAGHIVQNYLAYSLPVKDSSNKKQVADYTHEIGTFVFDENFNTLIGKKETFQDAGIRKIFPADNGNMVNCVGFEMNSRKISFAFDLRRKLDSNYFTYRRAFEIPQYENQNVSISDLVTTNNIDFENVLPFGIKRGDLSFYPKLNNKFKNKEQFYIYYEAYNLKKDNKKEANFEQVITIKPKGEEGISLKKIVQGITTLFSGEEGKISLTTDYKTKEENTQVYMQLDLAGYKPGKYDFIITLNDKISGKTTQKQMDLEIY